MAKNFSYSAGGNADITLNSFVEISIDPILLNNFSTEDSLHSYFNSYSSTEEFQELKAQLLEEVMYIVENQLTEKQREVVVMTYVEGKTQNEIAIELGKAQSAVHKGIHGNIDYTNDGKRYGGAIKKMKRLCSENENIKNILVKMREGYTREL